VDLIDVELFSSLRRAALTLAANPKPEQTLDAMLDVDRVERQAAQTLLTYSPACRRVRSAVCHDGTILGSG
jgi:hypothetical protein